VHIYDVGCCILCFRQRGGCLRERCKSGVAGTGAPEKEIILSKNSKDVIDRAEASFKKEERAREGAKAMRDYEAEGRAVREKTARLRSLRLAKEATEAATEKAAQPKKATRQSKITPSP
jgi:hypothetical protein